MKKRPHVVLDDAVAEKIRSSWLFRLRSMTSLPIMAGPLVGMLAAMVCNLAGNTSNYGLLLCLVLAALTYWLACLVVTDNDELDPLTSSFSLKKMSYYAAENPAVAAFVSDALGKGNTLRIRDLKAAYRIDRDADAQRFSGYGKAEAEEAAKVRAELAATYGPADSKQ